MLAYYQIKIDIKSRPCTAFSVSSKGTFQYARMVMGLSNAASTLCELIQRVIGCDLEPYVYPYLDDFLVLTKSFDQHMEVLSELRNRLTNAGLTISSQKSFLLMKQTSYVGYIISEEGIQVNPDRMKPIMEFPIPKNLKAVRRFLGMTGWYRRFIPNFSDETKAITDLLKQNQGTVPFRWTQEANESFENLKTILTRPPILTPPDFSQHFTIQCDASDTGVGAVLTQKNYSATEKECLAVILAIKRFRPYVDGIHFTVTPDGH